MKLSKKQAHTLERLIVVEQDRRQSHYRTLIELKDYGETWAEDEAKSVAEELEELAELKEKLWAEMDVI